MVEDLLLDGEIGDGWGDKLGCDVNKIENFVDILRLAFYCFITHNYKVEYSLPNILGIQLSNSMHILAAVDWLT